MMSQNTTNVSSMAQRQLNFENEEEDTPIRPSSRPSSIQIRPSAEE
jgi:hypothetical protein